MYARMSCRPASARRQCRLFGADCRRAGLQTAIVTARIPASSLSSLRGIEWRRLPSDQTTTFENVYSPAGRTQLLHATAGPIRSADVPFDWRRADVVHLAPIADEVDPALAAASTAP